jgi:hypothetical protein
MGCINGKQVVEPKVLKAPKAGLINSSTPLTEGPRVAVGLDPREQLILEWLQKRADSSATTCTLGLLQTYDASSVTPGCEERHDVYDNAVVAILFDLHLDHQRAEKILTGFITKIDEQSGSDSQLLWPSYQKDGTPTADWRQDAGDNAWAIMALAFHGKVVGNKKFTDKAVELKDKVKQELAFTQPNNFDPLKPHSVDGQLGETWSSTEHSTDLCAVGRMCSDDSLLETCQKFVGAMWVPDYITNQSGAYMTGTTPDGQLNYSPCPVDCQTWTLLADVDPIAQEQQRDLGAMRTVQHEFVQQEIYDGVSYYGVLFSIKGAAKSGIQMENTASSSMAIAKFLHRYHLSLVDSKTLQEQLDAMANTLQQLSSNNNGAVLACVNPDGISQGFDSSITYAPTPHLGSTAWTGLLFGAIRSGGFDPKFNPYQL